VKGETPGAIDHSNLIGTNLQGTAQGICKCEHGRPLE
jgi:hypothetical protein